ncbi:MAG: hypothetical protein RL318_477 [Fibrobacterota bacterium]|jgi:hypothetical protein
MTARNLTISVLIIAGLARASGLQPSPLADRSTGGTGVVTSTGKDVLFANPARLGLAGIDVGMDDHGPRDDGGWEMSWTALARNPGKLTRTIQDHKSSLQQTNLDTVLARDPELFDILWDYNRQAVSLRQELRLDFHGREWGASAWSLGDFGLLARHGELYPSGRFSDTLATGLQFGMSRTLIRHELMVGASLKSIWATSWAMEASAQAGSGARDTILSQARREFSLNHVEWVAAMDLGVLWLPTPQVHLGSSLRDLGMVYRNALLTPEWDLGAAWYPAGFQQGGKTPSHLSLAATLVDILNSDQGWKPLSKIGLGAEYAFSPFPWRLLNFRLSAGALSGYPTAGLGLDILRAVRLDIATWAHEAGWYTGQRPDRKWAAKAAVGW